MTQTYLADLLIVLVAAMATEWAGLSMALGAFLAGLLMSESTYRHQVMAEIRPFRGLLLGLFFISMGMLQDLYLLLQRPFAVLALLGALLLIKVAVLFPLAPLTWVHRLGHIGGQSKAAETCLIAGRGP